MRSRRLVGRRREARRGGLKRYVLDHGRAVAIMVGASCAAGVAYNFIHPRGIFVPEQVSCAPERKTVTGAVPPAGEVSPKATRTASGQGTKAVQHASHAPVVTPITLEQAKKRYDEHNALFVDARARSLYDMGHIPGALSVPSSTVGSRVPSLPGGRDSVVVVYCVSPDCDEAEIVAKALAGGGYSSVLIFKEGWNAWYDAGYPQQKTSP